MDGKTVEVSVEEVSPLRAAAIAETRRRWEAGESACVASVEAELAAAKAVEETRH